MPNTMAVEPTSIEQALGCLVGLPLSYMKRFSGWQRFEFGVQKPFTDRKGQEGTRADYALHAACDWRIIGHDKIIVGSADYGPGAERDGEDARPFFARLAETPPTVESVIADTVGSIHLRMTGGYQLDIMPMGIIQEEQWLFFLPEKGSFTLDEKGFGS